MASGLASHASLPSVASSTTRPIGAQTAQQAAWISRRADRIQRAAAWDGNVGNVSPALVDRFSQRVADRVQRSTRAHQVDSFAGGDNLDGSLDMPLVTNDGSITPLSEDGSDETPFEFGSFSPENVQRKAAPQPAIAPAAPPPMSHALRERAEQLRRSLADGTPAPPPAITPSPISSLLQPSRATGASVPAPRVSMQRAKPVSRVEEIGIGRAPKPAPPAAPTPEPPSQAVQRKAQTPSSRPASPSVPVPTVQRAAIPPNVVQGQGRLTQMLNARFKPKLDTARNPEAPSTPANDNFSDSDAGISDAPVPRISRKAQPPADVPGVSDDLTPRAPIRHAPAHHADDAAPPDVPASPSHPTALPSPADVSVPTPKARVLRKPATPTMPATSPLPAPVVQPRPDDRAAAAMPASSIKSASTDAPSSSVQPTTPAQDASVSTVQRKAADRSQTDVQPESAAEPAIPSAPTNTPAIQRETSVDATGEMPLVAPAVKDTPATSHDSTDGNALIVQRSVSETPLASSQSNVEPAIQRSTAQDTAPAAVSKPNQVIEAKLEPPAMVLRTPATSASTEPLPANEDAPSEDAAPAAPAITNTVQRSIAPAAPATPTGISAESSADLTLRTPATPASTEPAPTSEYAPSEGAAPATRAVTKAVQRSLAPAAPVSETGTRAEAPADLTLRMPATPASDVSNAEVMTSASPTVQRSVVPDVVPSTPANAPVPAQSNEGAGVDLPEMTLRMPAALQPSDTSDSTPNKGTITPILQRSAQSYAPDTPISSESATQPAIQRVALNPPPTPEADATDALDVNAVMPLVQRALIDETGDAVVADDNAAPAARALTPAASTPSQAGVTSNTGQTPAASDSMGVIQRATVIPGTHDDAAGDLTLRVPATREADAPVHQQQDGSAPSTPVVKAAPVVQRTADTSATTHAPSAAKPFAQSERVQRDATMPPRSSMDKPAIQRSASSEMVLRSLAASPKLPTQDAPAGQGMSQDIAEPATYEADATPMPLVQRAFAADAAKSSGSRMKADAMPALRMRGLGMSDMPVLRGVTQPATEAAPEVRTLSMPIVQRAAVKQEQQAAQEAQARPANPFVAQQERIERMPVVQRKPAVSEVPEVQRELDPDAAAVKPEGGNATAPAQATPNRAITDAELTRAAQRILPLIKRMLAIERERLFGR